MGSLTAAINNSKKSPSKYLRRRQLPARSPRRPNRPLAIICCCKSKTQLERRTSVTARLRHQVSLDGRQLFGVGSYWQQGTGEDLHMRLELQFAAEDTSLLQVSNGRSLWTDQRLPAGRSITKLDLRKVRYELSRAEEDLDELEPGEPRGTMVEPSVSIRCGGLPTLLMSLSNCFKFSAPQSMRWTPAPKLEGLPDSFPVFAVVGHWKSEVLAQFLSEGRERCNARASTAGGADPVRPDRFVSLPHRVSPSLRPGNFYGCKRSAAAASAEQRSARAAGVVRTSRSTARSRWVSSSSLAGDAEWNDCTDDYLDGIRLHQQTQMATRKKTADTVASGRLRQ